MVQLMPNWAAGAMLRALVAFGDLDGFADHQEALELALQLDARRADQVDEGRRAAVHDWHLGTAELDPDVVHAQAAQGGEQVLDGPHARRRRSPAWWRKRCRRRSRSAARISTARGEVGPHEDDAAVRRGRAQGHLHAGAGVQANPLAGDGRLQRPLVELCHISLGQPGLPPICHKHSNLRHVAQQSACRINFFQRPRIRSQPSVITRGSAPRTIRDSPQVAAPCEDLAK